MSDGTLDLLFYGGICIIIVSIIVALIAFILSTLFKRILERKLRREYGDLRLKGGHK